MKVFIITVLFLLLFFILTISIYIFSQIGKTPSSEDSIKYEHLSYYKDKEFQSPEELKYDFTNIRNSNGKNIFLRFLGSSDFAPKTSLPKVSLTKDSFPLIPENFAVYWLGHSSAILEINGKRLLIDPVFKNAAPIPFAAPRYGEAPLKVTDLPKIDYIIITHNHYDHLEKSTVQHIKSGHFIVPLGLSSTLRGWGISESRITELGWKESFKDNDLEIIAREGIHFSGRSFKRNQTLWNSYIIISSKTKIFWGGDGGYGKHFSVIGEAYGGFDFGALEIDGWNTGWPNTHMFPEEVIQAIKDLRIKHFLPIHWGVFDLALHPWDESIKKIVEEADVNEINIFTPKIGEKINLNSKTIRWWEGIE